MKIYLCANAEAAANLHPQYAVETEWGSDEIVGSIKTLNHHGPRSSNPVPCLLANCGQSPVEGMVCAISHLDLDTLGGVLALNGEKPEITPGFWEAAAKVDLEGPHRLGETTDAVKVALDAYWAFSQANRAPLVKEGSLDVTDLVADHMVALQEIEEALCDSNWVDRPILEDGMRMRAMTYQLERSSFKQMVGRVVVRTSDQFTNHLYEHGGNIYPAVVALNTKTGACTLSFERPGIGDACKIMQAAFGPLAGGREGIAGSPRNVVISLEDTIKVAEAVANMLN